MAPTIDPPSPRVLFIVQKRRCPITLGSDEGNLPFSIEKPVLAWTYGTKSDIDRGVKIAIIRPIGKVGKVGRTG
jgi:hypothetical protein